MRHEITLKGKLVKKESQKTIKEILTNLTKPKEQKIVKQSHRDDSSI